MPDGSRVEFLFNAITNEYLLAIIGPRDRTIYAQWLTKEQGESLINAFGAMKPTPTPPEHDNSSHHHTATEHIAVN